MQQVALYFPFIRPHEAWLKRALLASDSISSIVGDLDAVPSPDRQLLYWLMDEGLWQPTYVRQLGDDYLGEIEDALLACSDVEGLRRDTVDQSTDSQPIGLYLGKLSSRVERLLTDLDLASEERHRLVVHPIVAAKVLAVTAKHAALNHHSVDSRLVPSTDLPASIIDAYQPMGPTVDRYHAVDLVLTGVMPSPGPEVSLDDVVQFRSANRSALLNLRTEVDRLVESIVRSEDPVDQLRSARTELEGAVLELKGQARSSRRRYVAGSIVVAGIAVATKELVDPVGFNVAFDGFVGAASLTMGSRIARGKEARSPYAYLLSAERQYGRRPHHGPSS